MDDFPYLEDISAQVKGVDLSFLEEEVSITLPKKSWFMISNLLRMAKHLYANDPSVEMKAKLDESLDALMGEIEKRLGIRIDEVNQTIQAVVAKNTM